jgi:anti-anti-sigma regulatory factor
MGLSFEINGHPSAIVVTLSGTTDLAALRPLQAALAAAMADGQAVVVDLDNLAHPDAGVLAELLAQAKPLAGRLRLVAATAEALGAIGALGCDPRIEIYPSVAAALSDRDFGPAPPAGRVDGQGGDLPAMFTHLSEGYRAAIEQCQQLLHRFEDATDNVSPPCRDRSTRMALSDRTRASGPGRGNRLDRPA